MDQGTQSVFEFGRFRLDPTQGVLLRDGQIVPLTPKALTTLAILAREGGRVVHKDELMREVWPDTFVEENSLTRNISVLRRALGDQPSGQPQIETVAKRGYRLATPVMRLEAETRAPEAPEANDLPVAVDPAASFDARQPPSAPGTREAVTRPARGYRVLGAAALTLVVGLFIWQTAGRTATSTGRPVASTSRGDLAVLPLQILTPEDSALRYLQIGIPDTVITRLANVRTLRLRPTSAVLRFAGAEVDAQRAGRELDVGHVLAGTLRAHASGYRVNLQLVRVEDGAVVWGAPYEITAANLPGLQDDSVAEHVAQALSLQLTAAERERLRRRYTQNGAAYADFLQGRALQVEYTEQRMRDAIARFEAALSRDPRYALARAHLAMALAFFSLRYLHEAESTKWAVRAEEEATVALKEDPNLADAHLALAYVAGTAYHNFDWPRVLEETAVALSIDPNLHLAHTARARVFYHYGLFEATTGEADTAATLAGYSGVENERTRFYALSYGGGFAEAFKLGEQLHQRTDAVTIPWQLAHLAYYLGDKDRAVAVLRARLGGSPDLRVQASLAAMEAAQGRHQIARELLRPVLTQKYLDHHVAYSLATTYAQLGEFDESARWLTEAANTGFPCYPWFMKDPLLAPLRQTSQFRTLEPSMRRTFDALAVRYGS
jgi:DNA-binding winged helix-turn-helix (wHTH) protein/TolB-like protein